MIEGGERGGGREKRERESEGGRGRGRERERESVLPGKNKIMLLYIRMLTFSSLVVQLLHPQS